MWSSGERARRWRGEALLGGGLLWLLVLAPPAAAHAVLTGSDPPDGATLPGAPRSVQLRFGEDVAARFSTARLVDAAGRPVGGSRVDPGRGGPRLLVLELPALRPGAYGVLWRVLSEVDGHTTSGTVVFTAGGPSAQPQRRPVVAGAGAAARPDGVARRWIGVCLLAGLVGALAVAGLVLERARGAHLTGPLAIAIRTARRRLLTLAVTCAALGAAGALGDAVAQVAGEAPAGGGWWPTAGRLLTSTRWGQLWTVREGALLALVVLTLALRSSGGGRPRWERALAAGAGAPLLATVAAEALGSHAAALDRGRDLAVAADALHLLTACLWLGTLPALVLLLWPQRWGVAGPADLLAASRGGLTALLAGSAGLAVVTGLYGAGRQVESVDRLWGTPYGRTLLVKAMLVLVVAGLGLVNAARLRGRVATWPRSLLGRLAAGWPSRRLVAAEAAAGAVLLLAVAMLVETAPARGPGRVAAAAPAPVESASGAVADLVVSVSATPNRPGLNGFTALVASPRRPPPAPVDGVAIELAGGGAVTGAVTLQRVGPDRWFGTGRLGRAGALRLVAVIHRAGRRLAVPLSWWVGSPAAPTPARAATAPERPLAPFVDGAALALVAAGLALALRLTVARRRRRPTGTVRLAEPQSEQRVLEDMR